MVTAPRNLPTAVPSLPELARNIETVRERIAAAALRAGRDAAGVTLIAVSKTVPVERLHGIETTGATDLGENRVQEAAAKIETLGRVVSWHLIGRLQRNKARAAVELFDLIHSVDDVELALTLDRHASALGKRQRVLLQVNVSGEESKGGFDPVALPAVAERLAALPSLRPEGLMTIAQHGAGDAELRRVFGALRALHERLAPVFGAEHWRHLSMGMSDDYETAVEEGATMARVGRAIFGERPLPPAQARAGQQREH